MNRAQRRQRNRRAIQLGLGSTLAFSLDIEEARALAPALADAIEAVRRTQTPKAEAET
ncbi:MAG: hypothetical protein ACRET2_17675 [Steroidobacteraceae bacterium]